MTKCKVCKFWGQSEEEKGLCRVLPPTLNHALGTGVWPYTHAEDSCGSGKPQQQ